jgi:hypothetical protein
MSATKKLAVLGVLLLPMAAVPASAQSWKWDWNVNGGYSWYSNMLDKDNTGLTGMTSASDVKFKAGGLLGSQLTFWFGPKLGLRFNGTYADRPVTAKNLLISSPAGSGISDVNLWSGSADLMIRFASPKDEFTKMEMLPYLALGFGGKWHNPAGDAYMCHDTTENKSWACAPFTVNQAQPLATRSRLLKRTA